MLLFFFEIGKTRTTHKKKCNAQIVLGNADDPSYEKTKEIKHLTAWQSILKNSDVIVKTIRNRKNSETPLLHIFVSYATIKLQKEIKIYHQKLRKKQRE